MILGGFQIFFLALLEGILPIVVWLWFWLKEDKDHPEPRRLIALSFLAGVISVPAALLLERTIYGFMGNTTYTIIIWAWAEEMIIFIACYFTVLRRKEDDEPIDPVIYMVTTALGFSALENMFFLTNTLIQDGITISIITMNLRFTGATLLHVISSAAIGIAIGLSFYKDTNMKRFYLFIGLLISAILHISFNLFIIINDGKNTISIFFFVWVMIAILILLFEKLKKVHPFKTQ